MKKIAVGFGIFILLLLAIGFLTVAVNKNEPPPQLVANFVDLNQINRISKFRSCSGHVTVPQDRRETKRSMKHYFEVKPEFNKEDAVKIYSPYDGYVSVLRDEPEKKLEGEIWIRPKSNLFFLPPFGIWQFSVQHFKVRSDLKMGSFVKAGDLLGYASFYREGGNSFDVVYGKMNGRTKMIDNWTGPFSDLDSVFSHMNDKVFSEYKKKSITTKENLITGKEERDSNPCQYQGEGPYFTNQDDPNNWVILQSF